MENQKITNSRDARVSRCVTYLMETRYHRRVGDLAADLGVTRQSLYAWKRGVIPKEDRRERLFDLYGEVKQEDEKED